MAAATDKKEIPVFRLKPIYIFMILNHIKSVENRKHPIPKKYLNRPVLLFGEHQLTKNKKVAKEISENFDITTKSLAKYKNKIAGAVIFTGNIEPPDDDKLHTELAYMDWPIATQFHWKIGQRMAFKNFTKYAHKSYHTWSTLNSDCYKKLEKDGIFKNKMFK